MERRRRRRHCRPNQGMGRGQKCRTRRRCSDALSLQLATKMKVAKVGAMQGRLLPPEPDRFQSFPVDAWRDEFALARKAGLACIEWIYEEPNEDRNPLCTDRGVAE